MSSSSPSQILPPDIIHGVSNKTCTLQSSKLNFSSGISSEFPKLKRRVHQVLYLIEKSSSVSIVNLIGFKISPSILSSQRQHNVHSTSNISSTSQQSSTSKFTNNTTAPRRQFNIKRKPDFSLEEYSLPPQRMRKLPNRSKMPQLRVSLHQDLRNMRTSNSVLPESILSKYRSSPRSGNDWSPSPSSL